MTALLEARGLDAGYDQVPIVRGLDIAVSAGEVVALLGPNGAGKTTTLLTLAGYLRPLAGEVDFLGEPAQGPLHRRARRGLGLLTEERSIFMQLTSRQNLGVATADVGRATGLFPELVPLMSRRAGLLSGGEQQMLALAGVLARTDKRLLLADELSLGLAPLAVGWLLQAVRAAADDGLGVLLVEQHVHRVLDIADRVYVLSHGRVEYSGTAEQSRGQIDEIQAHYLGRDGPAFTTVDGVDPIDQEEHCQ
jgi:branched-chain amino acid transport system ATP-binding protein